MNDSTARHRMPQALHKPAGQCPEKGCRNSTVVLLGLLGEVVGVMVWPSGVEGFAVDCPRGFELVFECEGC